MTIPSEVLEPLFDMFEQATYRVIEGSQERLQQAVQGHEVRGRRRAVSRAFRQLKKGEITLDDFLSLKVERALRPLRPLLDEEDIAFLRILIRERLDGDPVFASLVSRIKQFTQAERPAVGANATKTNGDHEK